MGGSATSGGSFRWRVSTVFLVMALVAIALPTLSSWGVHDGGYRAALAFGVFPVASLVAFVSSFVYLVRRPSFQSRVEVWLSASVVLGVAVMFL